VHLHPPLLGELLPDGQNARMVMTMIQNADSTGKVQYSPAVPGVNPASLRVIDQLPAESEGGH
jgi:hypothetical protein